MLTHSHANAHSISKADVDNCLDINTLPVEIRIHIFRFLDPKEWGRYQAVCRSWYGLLKANVFWGNTVYLPILKPPQTEEVYYLHAKFQYQRGVSALQQVGNPDPSHHAGSSRSPYHIDWINRVKDLPFYELLPFLEACPKLVIHTKFKDVFEVARVLVRQSGMVLKHLKSFQGDPHIVADAYQSNPKALEFADQSLREKDDFIALLLSKNGRGIKYVPRRFKDMPRCIRIASKSYPAAIRSSSLRNNIDFMTELVIKKGALLEYASYAVRSHFNTAILAIQNDARAVKFIAVELINSPMFISKALSLNGLAIKFLSLYQNNRSLVWLAFRQNPNAIKYAGNQLRSDHHFMRKATEFNPKALECASPPVKRAFKNQSRRSTLSRGPSPLSMK